MTNSQLPSYSGVTINISNPTVTTNPIQTNCPQIPQYQYNTAGIVPQNTQATITQPQIMQPQIMQPQVREVTNSLEQNIAGQVNTPEITPQAQLPQAYPPSYYLNNYNYTQNGGQNSLQPAVSQPATPQQTNEIQDVTPIEIKEEDMSSSTEIINDLNARVAKEKALEENGKQTKVVALTDEYIMSLENYLNNQNTDIRLMAAKEILTRLDEDKTRYDDAALNALLNKMLQDPQKLIRIAALSAFSSGLASGNEYTVQLLNNIQQNPNSDKEDVVEAANILLKMSSDTEIRYTPVQNNIPIQAEQKAE